MAKTNKSRKFFATTATAALVASAIVPVASAAQVNDFNSIASYAQEAVQNLVDRGVVEGDANGNFQPRKSVSRAEAATVLSKALDLITTGDVYFTDVKSGAWYYDSINAAVNNGIFQGKGAGIFEPNGNLTRGEAAVILVNAFGLEKTASLAQFADEKTVKPWAVEALEIAVGNGVILGDNGKIKANDAITKQDFAVMFARAEAAGQENQDKQEASTVVPTAVAFEESSLQSPFGETVTLKAKVTVEAGESAAKIPVTFAINPDADELLQEQIKTEVLTDENGVATYTYTRYKNKNINFKDTVIAYATAKQAVRDASAVYWGTTLKVSDVTEATTLANGEQKVYQVTGTENSIVFVTFKENLNVKPDTAVRTAYLQGTALTTANATDTTTIDTANIGVAWFNPEDMSQHTPYLLESGVYSSGLVRLDETGKANIVVTGKNAEVTPIVYSGAPKYAATSLQATASKVKFEAESLFNLTVEALGSQNAAYEYDTEQYGGRDYTVTLKGTDGKVMPNATVKVGFDKKAGTLYTDEVSVYVDGEKETAIDGIYELTTDQDGKVTFTVTGTINNYATPIVFIGKSLTDYEIQTKSEMVYFNGVKASNYTSVLKVTNEALEANKEVLTFGNGATATFTYQLSDQNGKPRSYANANLAGNGETSVTFTVRAGAKPVTVDGVSLDAYATKSITKKIASTATNISLDVKGEGASEVRVTATPTNSGLSGLTSITQRVNFLAGASTSYFTISNVNATATTIDSVTLTFTEAVTSNDIFVNVNGASVTADSATNNKVLYVYFNDEANKPAAKNGEFTIAYKGKTYVVTTDEEGKLNITSR